MKFENIFNEIAEQYYKSIFKYCYVKLDNEHAAKDCTQEVFLTLYRKMDKLKLSENVRAWLYRTEPVLQIGRYYLNGNDDKCFFEVMPNNIIALNGSDEDIFELHKTKYPNYDTVITNEEKSAEELLKNDIEFWNTPHEYFVRTEIYPNETITIVAVKWTTDIHGNYSSLSGLGYIDSQTLRYCGFDFTLSEKN